MTSDMEIVFLGTGTSQGIPVIGCSCTVCQSEDIRDKRYRTSAMVKVASRIILIDVSPDFRSQMLDNMEDDLDAILLTHEHNDHIIGMDDIRPINFKHRKNIPVYGQENVLQQVRQKFYYAFADAPYPGAPKLDCINVEPGIPFDIPGLPSEIVPLLVHHAQLEILGFRIGDMAYITDASYLSEETLLRLNNLKMLVINALQHTAHYSHFTLKEALEVIEKVKPESAYLTHLSHHLGTHEELLRQLPPGVFPAFDKLRVKM